VDAITQGEGKNFSKYMENLETKVGGIGKVRSAKHNDISSNKKGKSFDTKLPPGMRLAEEANCRIREREKSTLFRKKEHIRGAQGVTAGPRTAIRNVNKEK